MSDRTLGWIALLGSPMLFAQGALDRFGSPPPTRQSAVLGLVFLIGWSASAVALRCRRATGSGTGAAIVFALQLAGLGLAAMQQVQDFLYTSTPPQTLFYGICDAAWPLSVLFMLVVGGFAIAAGVLRGWRRWTPLLCGFALPILLVTVGVAGQHSANVLFSVYTGVAWGLAAVAVLRP